MLQEFATENNEFRNSVSGQYTSAGDKYRLTLVNISGVENWFKPGAELRPCKKMLILLVPCSSHCRLEDIDVDGRWVRYWSHKCSDGSEKHYKKGDWAKNMLASWRAARGTSSRARGLRSSWSGASPELGPTS